MLIFLEWVKFMRAVVEILVTIMNNFVRSIFIKKQFYYSSILGSPLMYIILLIYNFAMRSSSSLKYDLLSFSHTRFIIVVYITFFLINYLCCCFIIIEIVYY